jgi:S-adenosylmethionine-dependent methyltransferase
VVGGAAQQEVVVSIDSQTEDSLRRSYDNIASTYDHDTATFAHQVHEYVTQSHLTALLERCKPTTILDAGGGTGKWTYRLARLGYRVVLVDISPKSLLIARKRLTDLKADVQIVEGNVENVDLPSQSVDFILSQGPMSYTPDPSRMLNEMYRLLEPGGRMWLEFYNAVGWAAEVRDLRTKTELALTSEKLIQMPDWDYPARVFSLSRAKILCAQAGFGVEATFGNHVLLGTLPLEQVYAFDFNDADLLAMQKAELELSSHAACEGVSKNLQFLCHKLF